MYDTNNVFAKIIRGEIPANKIYENEHALSFYDVNPVATTHALVVPKGEYTNILEFLSNASADEQTGFWDCFNQTAQKLDACDNCNIVANVGRGVYFAQSVLHFHMHIIAGQPLVDLKTTILEH